MINSIQKRQILSTPWPRRNLLEDNHVWTKLIVIRTIWIFVGSLAFPLIAIPIFTFAQNGYPLSPIRLVVAFPPGASQTDVAARLLAQRLSAQMNIGVVVDNK